VQFRHGDASLKSAATVFVTRKSIETRCSH